MNVKVIGTGPDNSCLLEASPDEMAQLLGFYSHYDGGYKRPQLGAIVTVSEMYQRLYDLARRKGTLTQTAKELRFLADLLEVKAPVIFPQAETATTEKED